jgi:putative NADH-flavin reductase
MSRLSGGAGFLGINLCRSLLERGCVVRSPDIAPFDYPERDAVDVINGDIRDHHAVDRAVAGVDIVVHCAAALLLSSEEEILSTVTARPALSIGCSCSSFPPCSNANSASPGKSSQLRLVNA